ncbi:MAG: carbon monoxide dehydrogenase subunit G [Bacteroidota bacterium]
MHLEGTHVLQASPAVIWGMLMDPDTLAKVTPAISSLEQIEEGKFNAISEVKIGPVKGNFKGSLEVVNPVEPEKFTLLIKQKSKIGNVSAEGTISLHPKEKNVTEVEFAGDAKLSGTIARTSQRLVNGVAKTLTNQFFEALEVEIEQHKGNEPESKSLWARIVEFFKNLFGN